MLNKLRLLLSSCVFLISFFVSHVIFAGEINYLHDVKPLNIDGTVNAVIEISAGSTEKWEVKKDGKLQWDKKDGKPRFVEYLGYPCNYGMIPRTQFSKEIGGDGDPLDVLVLGKSISRGEIVRVKIIGLFRMVDKGELDDKLVAVVEGTPFFELNSIEELDKKFIGVTNIIKFWFENYKGPGIVQSEGFGNIEDAKKVLDLSMKFFQKSTQKTEK